MATLRVTDSEILALWKTMKEAHVLVRVTNATFQVGQHVRIIKEKMRLAKAAEQNFSTENLKVAKIIEKRPLAV